MPPEKAAAKVRRLQAGLTTAWLDIAVQQDCTAMADCPSLQAWRAGRPADSIRLLLSPAYLEANIRDFITLNRDRKAAGVSLERIYLVDHARQEQDASCRAYLGWLREVFRQVNVPWSGEQVHWLPMQECARAGIRPPLDDLAFYDSRILMTSQYSADGRLTSRTFCEAGEDPGIFSWARALAADLRKLVAGGAYLLRPAAGAAPCPWPAGPAARG
jgi:hypothetical protein